MSKQSIAQRRREKRLAIKASEAVKKQEVGEKDADLPEVDSEVVEKDMGAMAMGYMPPMPPTTWEELDAQDAAEEQAHEVRETTWDVQDLVNNIVYCSDMAPDAKAKAISDVGKGYGKRLSDIMSGKMVEKDLDVLSAEVVLAQDSRTRNLFSKVYDSLTKAKLTAAEENKMTDSQFALVRDENGTKVRKYPIHDANHVRNALARAAQEIKAGGQAAADAKAALPKIHAAAKKMGIGQMDTKKDKTAIVVEKDASGSWRWVGWYTNKFVDTDNDIFSEAAHKEYEGWLDEHPQLSPVFMSWHTPGTARKNAVDFLHYENGFVLVSGKLEEDEAAGLMRVMKEETLGMSHQSFVQRDPKDPRIILKYRTIEVSDLPVQRAANPFTSIPELVFKEADMLDKKGYLASVLGSVEKAQAYLDASSMLEKGLSDAGVESKENTAPPTEPKTEVPPAPPVDFEAELSKVMKEKFAIDDFAAFVAASKEATEKVPALEAALKAASADQDQRLAAMISPRAGQSIQDARVTKKDDSKIDKTDPLASSTPGIPEDAWLSKVTGTMPLPQEV